MAHVRKDTLTRPVEWAKHLRPWGKKLQSKKERQAAIREIVTDIAVDQKGASLRRDATPRETRLSKSDREIIKKVKAPKLEVYRKKVSINVWFKAKSKADAEKKFFEFDLGVLDSISEAWWDVSDYDDAVKE